eukprot:Pgem_evm1s1194
MVSISIFKFLNIPLLLLLSVLLLTILNTLTLALNIKLRKKLNVKFLQNGLHNLQSHLIHNNLPPISANTNWERKWTLNHKLNKDEITTFEFTAVAVERFKILQEHLGIDPIALLHSLTNEPLSGWENPAKSGSVFYISNDKKYIFKSMLKVEYKVILRFLNEYIDHILFPAPSLLTKILGIYRVKTGVGQSTPFLLMPNMLPEDGYLDEKYDMKGAEIFRTATRKELRKPIPTLKDNDFFLVHDKQPLLLFQEDFTFVHTAIVRDADFLKKEHIMDYSFLLGMVHSKKTNKHNSIRNNMQTSTVAQNSNNNIIHANVMTAYNAQGEEFTIYIGVIDIINYYHVGNSALHHALQIGTAFLKEVEITPPPYYADRFVQLVTEKVFQPIQHPPQFNSLEENEYQKPVDVLNEKRAKNGGCAGCI